MNGMLCFARRVAIAGVLIAQLAAAPLLFDMGTETSDVWAGFTRVTAKTVWSGESAFGWKSSGGLSSRVMAYKEPVSNPRRGASEPPPIWTNAITEDAVIGSSENSFLFPSAPG